MSGMTIGLLAYLSNFRTISRYIAKLTLYTTKNDYYPLNFLYDLLLPILVRNLII